MNFADVDFVHGLAGGRERSDKVQRIAMAERLEMILERLAADRDAFFEDNRGLAAGQRVALDRVRAVGQLDIVPGRQRFETLRSQRPQPVEPLFAGAQPIARDAAHRAGLRAGNATGSSIPAGSSWMMISACGKARPSSASTASETSCACKRFIWPSISIWSWMNAVGPAMRVRMSWTAATSGWLSAIARTRARSSSGSSRSISWVKERRAILTAL